VSAALHALQSPLFAHTTSDADVRTILSDRRNIITKQCTSTSNIPQFLIFDV
jgi:hypothetical protein